MASILMNKASLHTYLIPRYPRLIMTFINVLLTGYEPFLDHAENPSQKIAEALNGYKHAISPTTSFQIESRILPVDTQGASTISQELKQGDKKWNLILHLGLDGRATKIYVETAAWNCCATRSRKPLDYLIFTNF